MSIKSINIEETFKKIPYLVMIISNLCVCIFMYGQRFDALRSMLTLVWITILVSLIILFESILKELNTSISFTFDILMNVIMNVIIFLLLLFDLLIWAKISFGNYKTAAWNYCLQRIKLKGEDVGGLMEGAMWCHLGFSLLLFAFIELNSIKKFPRFKIITTVLAVVFFVLYAVLFLIEQQSGDKPFDTATDDNKNLCKDKQDGWGIKEGTFS